MNVNNTELELVVEAIESLVVAAVARAMRTPNDNPALLQQQVAIARDEVKDALREVLINA